MWDTIGQDEWKPVSLGFGRRTPSTQVSIRTSGIASTCPDNGLSLPGVGFLYNMDVGFLQGLEHA